MSQRVRHALIQKHVQHEVMHTFTSTGSCPQARLPAPSYPLVSPIHHFHTIPSATAWQALPQAADGYLIVTKSLIFNQILNRTHRVLTHRLAGIAPGGKSATCVDVAKQGGVSFLSHEGYVEGVQPFKEASEVQFWIRSDSQADSLEETSTPKGQVGRSFGQG